MACCDVIWARSFVGFHSGRATLGVSWWGYLREVTVASGFQKDMQRARQGQAQTRRKAEAEMPAQPPAGPVKWTPGDSGRPKVEQAHESLTPRTHAERNA